MKLLSAIVLILWTACFLHCSAEQFGVWDCEDCSTCCPAQDCESEPCSDSENDSEAPCGLCDYLTLGGVPTISPLVLESFTDVGIDIDTAFLLTSKRQIQTELIPYLTGMCSKTGEVRPCAPLYSDVAGKILPARGPNV